MTEQPWRALYTQHGETQERAFPTKREAVEFLMLGEVEQRLLMLAVAGPGEVIDEPELSRLYSTYAERGEPIPDEALERNG